MLRLLKRDIGTFMNLVKTLGAEEKPKHRDRMCYYWHKLLVILFVIGKQIDTVRLPLKPHIFLGGLVKRS